MTYATAAPATSGGQGNNPPICQNCTTSTTPLWRRDEAGSVLCNACGLFLKLHGRPRPISLKTDVIKSRNRVKTSGPNSKKKIPSEATILPAAHPDAAQSSAILAARRASQKLSSGASDRSNSPISRTGTPGMGNPGSNIAPQHLFDGAALDPHNFHSPSLPGFTFRQPSPGSASSVNGSNIDPPIDAHNLYITNNTLKTRVSELEVINDLFRGRVSELENSEQNARRNLEESLSRETELKRRIEELENELAEYRESGHRHKKMRLSDIVDDSRTSSPMSATSQ